MLKVGGSIAGLFIGILLCRQGHRVRIFDCATSAEREGLAVGIGLAAQVQRFLDENDRLRDIPLGTPSPVATVLDENLQCRQKIPVGFELTTWDALYYRLRANFDAFKSLYCPQPAEKQPDDGEAIYENGVKVIRVEEKESNLLVFTENVTSGVPVTYTADFVIGADGGSSTIRRQVLPLLERTEPGYMIWRGVVPTKQLPQDFLDIVEHNTVVYPAPNANTYFVIYTIPGENGALGDKQRYLNVAWYAWPDEHSISTILTDTVGRTHRTTLPKGKMQPHIWAHQLARVKEVAHPHLSALVEQIREPFVSVVSSVISPQASFFNDRLFLIGDALAQVQPNLGRGTNVAATAAMCLGDVFAGKKTVQDLEALVEFARQENIQAIEFAAQFLYSS